MVLGYLSISIFVLYIIIVSISHYISHYISYIGINKKVKKVGTVSIELTTLRL